MPYHAPALRQAASTSLIAASATGITALNATTKVAMACWLRIPQGAAGGDLFGHANDTPTADGYWLTLVTASTIRLRTANGTTVTSYQAPLTNKRFYQTGIPFHLLVVASSVTGFCDYFINGKPIGRSATTVVAFSTAGTRRTFIGTYSTTATDQIISDCRIWAQNDADPVIASPAAYAQLAMRGRPAGESARYLWGSGTSGRDDSGNGRHLTWNGAGAGQVATQAASPSLLYERRRRPREIGKSIAAASVLFRPYFLNR